MSLYSLDNNVFRSFMFYGGISLVKIVFMSPLTGIYRVGNKTFANPEDAAGANVKVNRADESVERVRRAHLNDMENILPFLALGLLYISTDPSYNVANNCFRTFAFARIAHTLFYLNKIGKPRGLAFAIGLAVNLYMGYNIITSSM